MQGFKSPSRALRFLSAYGLIAQHFRLRRHLLSAGRHTTWHLPTGATHQAEYGGGRRLTAVVQGSHSLLRQQWRGEGQLASAADETFVLRPEYRHDGVRIGVLVTAPEEGPLVSR
jgi:hypothetical protein